MNDATSTLPGPDLARGVSLSRIPDGSILQGHANGEPVILARRDEEVFAIGAFCSHYGAPLKDGLLVGDTIRCPWHHACFSLDTGKALRAPALNAVPCWSVKQRDGVVYVGERLPRPEPPRSTASSGTPESVVIVGGGAAGNAAAETLRGEGYSGRITMLSADASAPCDRPNLSKGYLAGAAPMQSNPLRSLEFYRDQHIDLQLNARVAMIDTAAREVILIGGTRLAYDALLLATGAEPVRLDIPGSDLPHVHYLRTLADGEALVSKAMVSQQAVVIGASFIGLEVTASLRARNIAVHVVAPDAVPMERILGVDVGKFIRRLHERNAVTFHLGTTVASIDERGVTLKTGEQIAADLVVVGIGVRPSISLAKDAGLAIDRGVSVDEYLETSIHGIFAAGDIARWPDRLTGERIRVEHWVVAERQGQTAARNMLGRRERFDAVPFFWTEQYDFSLAYVGHAERFDEAKLVGQLDDDAHDCTITFKRDGRKLAVALVHEDLAGLQAELDFERTMAGEPREENSQGGRPRDMEFRGGTREREDHQGAHHGR
jgi:apoptosis-inducing factor 3